MPDLPTPLEDLKNQRDQQIKNALLRREMSAECLEYANYYDACSLIYQQAIDKLDTPNA